jgi:hypothetical protein
VGSVGELEHPDFQRPIRFGGDSHDAGDGLADEIVLPFHDRLLWCL